MLLKWEDLLPSERELAEKVSIGQTYDGGWEFRKRPARQSAKGSSASPRKLLVEKYGPRAQKTGNTQAASASTQVDRTPRRAASDDDLPVQARPAHDPGIPWGDPRGREVNAVSAQFIEQLITGRVLGADGQPIRCLRGVNLRRVRIDGTVTLRDLRDISGGPLPPLRLERCLLLERAPESDAAIDVSGASIAVLSLAGSLVDGIAASSARIEGDCDLSRVTLLRIGNVDLRGAKIAHTLRLTKLNAIDGRGNNEFQVDLRGAHIVASIAADFLADRPPSSSPGAPKPLKADVKAESLIVDGDFDLFFATVSRLDLWKARIGGYVRLQRLVGDNVTATDMHCGQLDLSGAALGPISESEPSKLVALDLSGVEVASELYANISDRLRVNGSIVLSGAKIGGGLHFEGASVRAASEYFAIAASAIRVGRGVFFGMKDDMRFEVAGKVGFDNARISGGLDMRGAQITAAKSGQCFDADSADIEGIVSIGASFADGGEIIQSNFIGAVSFIRAKMGTFACQGCVITSDEDALDLCSSEIPGGVYARCQTYVIAGKNCFVPGLQAVGTVRFVAARVNHLDFEGASLTAVPGDKRGGVALDIAEAIIQGKVRLNHAEKTPFKSEGIVRLRQTTIESDLIFSGGQFSAAPGKFSGDADAVQRYRAIECEGVIVKGHVFLGARYPGKGADRASTICSGAVIFDRAAIQGDLVVGDSLFGRHPDAGSKPTDEPDLALSLKNATITGDLVIRKPPAQAKGSRIGIIDFSGAQLRAFDDNDGLDWGAPPQGHQGHLTDGLQLRLDACVFQAFMLPKIPVTANSLVRSLLVFWNWLTTPVRAIFAMLGLRLSAQPSSSDRRLAWLNRQFVGGRPRKGDFFPHAYAQTARVLAASGRSADARRIVIGQRKAALTAHAESGFDRLWSRFYGFFFGFGQSPVQATLTTAGILMVGALITQVLVTDGWLVDRPDSGSTAAIAGAPQPCRQNPVFYALDQMLVVVDLDIANQCNLLDKPATVATASATPAAPTGDTIQTAWTQVTRTLAQAATWMGPSTFFGLYGILGTLAFFLTTLTFSGILRRDKGD